MTRFPIASIRAAFPSLLVRDRGVRRVCLDNPAGTQVPQCVWNAVTAFWRERNANLGGPFVTSVAAEETAVAAHRAMACFLGAADEREIVIGPSMTALTFAFSRSLARTWRTGDEIVLTRMDHDANISPWLIAAQERGVTVRWVPFDRESWVVEPDRFEAELSERTRLAAFTYASNLTGSVNDVAALCAAARRVGALSYVDAVQYAPHGAIDTAALGCDFLTCSSYKFFGPHLGILWGRRALLEELFAYKVRPATEELPWKFEVGTPQLELFAALSATVDYFSWIGGLCGSVGENRAPIEAAFQAASEWETVLVRRLLDGLEGLAGMAIAGITDRTRLHRRVPTVSFVHSARRPSEIARALAERNVFVWSGHNFALEVARSLGLDENEGVVRIGLAHYNDAQDVDAVLEALEGALSKA